MTFLIFQRLAITRKVGQRKVFSGQRKKPSCAAGKCFPFLVKRKTLSIFTKTHLGLSFAGLSPKTTEAEARRIDLTEIRSLDTFFRYFFPSLFLYIISFILYVFIFFVHRSVLYFCILFPLYVFNFFIHRSVSKKSFDLFNLLCLLPKKSMVYLLPVKHFPIPNANTETQTRHQFSSSSYLVTFKQNHRKNQANSSQASHKNYSLFSCTFGSFF